MAEIQTQFNKFHELIKIDFDGNKPLREKRDIILDALRTGLKKKLPTDTPTFNVFNQGSYDIGTGVEPLENNDYDIDVGVVFNFSKGSIGPLAIKQLVFNILNETYLRKVSIKKPCVRVQYHKAGEKSFHVDLAIYAKGEGFFGGLTDELFIAKGKANSPESEKIWETSEPHKLKDCIKNKITSDADREQFRRVIRYLKRWKDYNTYLTGNGRPTGIALTACCYNHFSVVKEQFWNPNTKAHSYKYNDLKALLNMVNSILGMFSSWSNRIEVKLPVRPYNNLFEKMTDAQMVILQKQLADFKITLTSAVNDTQVTSACMRLRSVFGNFPTS
jgi:hypothetical protein